MMGKWDREIQRVEGEKGRKRALTSEDCLGLVLVWARTRGSLWPLTMIFGVTLSPLKHYLTFGCYVLLECLRLDSDIQV
eukprot:9237964-Ditylum_brightwellii.AAC.1